MFSTLCGFISAGYWVSYLWRFRGKELEAALRLIGRNIRIFRRRIALDSFVVAAFGREAEHDLHHGSLLLVVLVDGCC